MLAAAVKQLPGSKLAELKRGIQVLGEVIDSLKDRSAPLARCLNSTDGRVHVYNQPPIREKVSNEILNSGRNVLDRRFSIRPTGRYSAGRRRTAASTDVLLRPRTHTPAPTTAAITAADLATRLYIFADDSMQGRLLATPGNVKGVEYIANEVKRMGLVPMGDNGTYFQAVNLVDRTFDDSTRLSAGSTSFTPWTDYILRVQGTGPQSLEGARVIYGTWGDSASFIDASAAAGKLICAERVPRAARRRAFAFRQ